MILVDANLLLYAYDAAGPQRARAKAWLEVTFSGPEPARVAWTTVLAFLRISTDSRIYTQPLTMKEAADLVGEWLAQPCVDVLEAGARHWPILAPLLAQEQVRGPLVMDAHLAALAIEHGAMLCTADRDFTRFADLKVRFPLQESPRSVHYGGK